VVGAYTAVMLLVTWYCCKRTLGEAPAELIRPKAPDAGKKILLEYLPIWRKVSFLNKVTIRNIFRYKQRLAMMMVGIGGCTALLLTGFGLRDSIVNVVDYQFEEVTTYDMSVYFSEDQTQEEQEKFLKDVSSYAENAMFYHQSSIELNYNNQAKEIYLIAADEKIKTFMDFHKGEEALRLPGEDEVHFPDRIRCPCRLLEETSVCAPHIPVHNSSAVREEGTLFYELLRSVDLPADRAAVNHYIRILRACIEGFEVNCLRCGCGRTVRGKI
jgi:hypothetical protein